MSCTKPVTLLTGASRGLGLAIVKLLLYGTNTFPASHVITISRTLSSELSDLHSQFPEDLITIQGDVTSESINAEAVKAATSKWGRLDAIILNAGVINMARIENLDTKDMLEQFNINTVSLVMTIKAALPELRKKGGRVVFVSSGAAVSGTGGWAGYNATKAAMNSICRTLANEEPKLGCFAVRPGVVDTQMQNKIRSYGSESMSSTDLDRFVTLHKEGKLVKPEQPGYTIAALALKGSRKEPKTSDGKGIGEVGGFVNWDADEMKGYKM